MKPFGKVTSVAAAILESDIDTDVIFPARFLVTLEKKGLGKFAFFERRRNRANKVPFVLDVPPFDEAQILVAGDKFGVGSSREHAVWALADLGVRCIIAPSFGEIFYSNCFKNGVLPITVDMLAHEQIAEQAKAGKEICVDLFNREISLERPDAIKFTVPEDRRQALLQGRDEIGSILHDHEGAIAAFEKRHKTASPWLFVIVPI